MNVAILGIDEVGRGPWAGPLVVGAVVLSKPIDGLADSKQLTKRRRETLEPIIKEQADGWGLGWVMAGELDAIGLAASLRLATRRAVEAITVPYHDIIIDGTINFLADTPKGRYVTILPKADSLIPAVSAASIVAKVARDTYMAEQALLYPDYGFDRHAGYGTAAHRQALQQYGVTPLHRRSFGPIRQLLGVKAERVVATPANHSSTQAGRQAETDVAHYLVALGHTIICRNYKTRWSEIDLISKLADTYYFTEVRYRRSDEQGGGLAAITPDKLRRMAAAAKAYAATLPTQTDIRLAAASVDRSGKILFIELG